MRSTSDFSCSLSATKFIISDRISTGF